MYSPLYRISVDPYVCAGEPCIRGTRVHVSSILDLLARGLTGEQILDEYPQLTMKDVCVVLLYKESVLRGLEVVRSRAC